MANDFNASLVISTSQAVTNVRNADAAVKDLDKTLAHLHTTMQNSQGDLDKVAKSLKVFTDTQRQSLRDQKAKDQALITASKLEREQIVTKGKVVEVTQKQTKAEQDLANAKAKGGQAAATSLGNATRKNAESGVKVAGLEALGQAKVATELERKAAAEVRTAAATAQRSAADDRAAISSLRLAAAQERANNSNLALNDSLSNSRYLLYDVAQTYAVLSAALLAIPVATTTVAASYEKDFTQVMRTTGLAGGAASDLFKELQQLGTQIPLSFGELANIASIAGQLGIAQDKVGAFTETVAKFGAASNVATSDAATAFGRLENSFNADGKIPDFFNKVGSAIVKVGINSAASETEIIAVTNQISAAGAQFGFTADQIVGLSGALASVRIRPELARGAFQRILLGLSRAADEGSASFDTFAKYTGVVGQAGIDLFKQDPSAFFNKYIEGIKGTIDGGTSVSTVLDDIGAKNVFDKQFILGLANGMKVYNSSLADSASAFKEGTFLSENTAATFETFAAMLQRVGTALGNLGARLGGGTLGPLEALAGTVLNVVTSFSRLLEQQPLIAGVINTLLLLGTVTGVFLAFKAAQAFVLAGLVGLQQVMGRASIAGALSLRGNVSELAKTMLMAKGASAQMAVSLLANKSSMQQLSFATTTTSASLTRFATVSTTAAAGSGAVATRTAVAAGAFRKFSGALLGVVGGPIGALVLGLGLIVTQLISTREEADQAGDSIARAMKNGADAGNAAAAEALGNRKVSAFDGASGFSDIGKSATEMARIAGVAFDKVVAGAAGGEKGMKAFHDEMDRVAKANGFKDLEAAMSNAAPGTLGAKLQFLNKAVTDINGSTATATANQKDATQATEALGTAAANAAPEAEGLKAGLEGVSGEAGNVSDEIGKAVDAIFGLVNAAAGTDAALSSLGEGLAKSTDIGTATDAGRNNLKNFQDTLRAAAVEQQQLVTNQEQTQEQAAATYGAFVDNLMKQLASKGVDVAQVQAMANQAKGIFGTTLASGAQPTMAIKVDASKVDDARAYLDSIVAKYGTTNLDVILREGGSKQVQDNVYNMQQYIEAATGTPYVAVVDSDAVNAYNGVGEFVQWGYSVFGTPFTATIDADADPFTQVMSFVAQYAASVVNGIIDGFNTINQAGHDITGGLLSSNQIGHVGWGAPAAPPKRQAPAVPNIPRPPAPSKDVAQQNDANARSLDALGNGYNDAAKAAKGAGDAGKKAGKDAADGIGEATKAADDYADRLKTGLQSAFDKQYSMTKATDEYHSALNAIKKQREDELAQVKDLIAKQKELNNSRKEDLVTARKAGIEKSISMKYGEVDRAADYANQEQTALDAAAAKQKDIDANGKTIASLQAGIGNFKGYSDAAIANREALRNLESKMLDMVSTYAATGKSQEQVREYAKKLTGQFLTDASQVYKNKAAVRSLVGEMGRYIGVIDRVPRTKKVDVSTSGTYGSQQAIGGVQSALNGLRDKKVTVTTERIFKGSIVETGNKIANGQPTYRVIRPDGTATNNILFNKGGQVPGFARGGMVPGKSPSDPSADNKFAQVDGKGMIKVRSGEFIVQQPAVDYYGLDFFKNLNNMKMSGFNAGGSVGGRAGGSSSGGAVLVELTAENIAAILRLAEKPTVLYADSTQLASTVNNGNAILASQGAN